MNETFSQNQTPRTSGLLLYGAAADLTPTPWRSWPVVPIEANGELLGFAEVRPRPDGELLEIYEGARRFYGNDGKPTDDQAATFLRISRNASPEYIHETVYAGSRYHAELPCEFFNHELKALEKALHSGDTKRSCSLFSDFGILGNVFFDTGIMRSSYEALEALGPEVNGIWQTRIAELSSANLDVVRFALPETAESVLNDLNLALQLVVAFSKFDDDSSRADWLEVSPRLFGGLTESACAFVNLQLTGLCPAIGYTDGRTAPAFPGSETRSGSLLQAIALQIWQFAADGAAVLKCSQCGNYFKRRRSKSRRSRHPGENAEHVFCCERCRNAFSQAMHRKTDGYKLKQERKKAAKQKALQDGANPAR